MRRTLPLLSALVVAALVLGGCGSSSPSGSAATEPVEATTPTTATPTPPTTAAPTGPVRVLVVGDSVMLQVSVALKRWAEAHPGQMEVSSEAYLGCGTTRGGQRRYEAGTSPMGDACGTWAEPVDPAVVDEPTVISWVTALEVHRPDVVVSAISGWDSIDRQVPELGDQWVGPRDPAYDEFARREYSQALDLLSSTGAEVAWLTRAYINHPGPYNDPARLDRLAEVILPLVDDLPRSTIIDFAGWLGPAGGERDLQFRPDGEHIAEEQFSTVADWLAPQLVAAAHEPASD